MLSRRSDVKEGSVLGMYVSPQKATFKKSMRGYKARQVDAYIETLCSDFVHVEEDYQARILDLEKQLEQAKEHIAVLEMQLAQKTPDEEQKKWIHLPFPVPKKHKKLRLTHTASALSVPTRRVAEVWGSLGRYWQRRRGKKRDKRRETDGSEPHDAQ